MTKYAAKPAAKYADYGLTEQEYRLILESLGRDPNHVEMGIFSAMWSEHCSYKHTRLAMREFPTQAPWVVQGPGENAGVVSIDPDWAVVFKVESHNHPSYVAPYDGAATGVGGLLRDVMAMGARPVGVKALLRSGPLDQAPNPEMIQAIQQGAGDYAAACGVASLGIDLRTHPSFAANPLVNVLVVGLARQETLMKSSAGAAGNLLFYFGRPTAADGIHGAAFASKGMDETTQASPPAGDGAAGYALMQAAIELIEQQAIEGLQDMGATGLTCSCFEMVHRAGKGLELHLDQVPQAGASPNKARLTAYELLLSETQERMLAAVKPEKLAQVTAILRRYPSLTGAVIGQVVDGNLAVLKVGGLPCASLPVDLVVDGFPRHALEGQPSPAGQAASALETGAERAFSLRVETPPGEVRASRLTPRQGAEVSGPCAAIDFPAAGKRILVRTLANGGEILSDPYQAAWRLVEQAAQDLERAGARPLALCDGLNFGSPDHPAVAFQIRETIRGLAQACRLLGIPVVGGNVSLFNETNHAPILGQVFVAMVGVAELGGS